MEWDMNTPWYRPTRVCMAADGSEFGWRNGTGKWPAYYPDSLPPIVKIGPGSPTGIAFGYKTKFPAKYQNALFICDWSYGKLYAVHLEPDQSAYKGTAEEFVTGTPLPLTDLVVSPHDGAMYFTIGGRKTLSGLYRVTYTGNEPTEPAAPLDNPEAKSLRAIRHTLEDFHGESDPEAVSECWPYLGHSDRFLRFAARVGIEFQDPETWQDKALSEKDPAAALTALLALTRVGDKSLQPRILESLDRISWDGLSHSQRLDLLRVYGLAFIRMGKPDDQIAKHVIARFDPAYPSKSRELNAELARMLIYLQSPSAAEKTVALLEKAPTQEEQIEYAMDLRNLKTGWTPKLRETYFSWFLKAANYKGGSSFSKFVQNIKNEAVEALTDEEKTALKPILEAHPAKTSVAAQPARPFVKSYTLEELMPVVQQGMSNPRDFDRGRGLFAAANCFACHRFDNEGGSIGPDLTGVSGRFSPRDLLESVVQPSKTVSDQYQAVTIATTDGQVVSGRIVNLHGNNMMVMVNMLDPNGQVSIDSRKVEEMRPSPVSMMPEGLLNTLSESEIQDLMAYLLSGGNREAPVYQKKSAGGGQE
jgi:putative heme-binding domain-containing protein